MNGRKLSILFGLLRNSTKIAAQFLGLGQSSQKAPGAINGAKQGLMVSTGLSIGRDLRSPKATES